MGSFSHPGQDDDHSIELCHLCDGVGLIGKYTCPACQPQSGPMGLDGWITCHYLDRAGNVQRFTHLSTEPLRNHVQRQEDIRAAMELMCRQLGYEVMSIQLVVVGTETVHLAGPIPGNVIAFPVRRGSSQE